MAPAARAILAAPGRLSIRATVLTTLLLGAVDIPGIGSGQEPPKPPYRIVRPQGDGPHPAVLFVSGCSGFSPHEAPLHYGRVADEFAARGFVVLFVDYLGTRGRQTCGGTIRPYQVGQDILAAVAYARSSSFIQASDISLIGWSMGGGGVLAAIAGLPVDVPSPFRAAVAYYPECYGITWPLEVRVPLLMLLAELDEVSWPWACQDLAKRLPPAYPVEVRVYPGARHAFDVPELPPLLRRPGGPIGHSPEAAAAATADVKRFLGR